MSDGNSHNQIARNKNILQSIEDSGKISEHNKEVALDFIIILRESRTILTSNFSIPIKPENYPAGDRLEAR